ncbi:fibronectin type III domain-containing protein [Flavivirga algicola]|uniref:Fibronectin type-III domain-containing protein n=1 Tax=Flavivirga algicola TaxID=2729136 RepID=A0ABX1RQW8_9FLAO|nr:hypothetical protein [Flavivirga algicola]NMH85949.1 hypothetical protein [Flavivirga algicola]
MKTKIILFLFLAGFCLKSSYAQQPIGDDTPAIMVRARVINNTVKLRWAPNTPTLWKYANQYGYYIERHTILRGDVILEPREIKRLNNAPIKPRPMMEWESFTEQNDMAAIAAQALYGEDFEVDMQEGGNPMMQILNQAQILEQRFAFALYAADLNYGVAEFSGLAFEDVSLISGEKYLYKIIPAIPIEKMTIKPGVAYIGLSDVKNLPKPQEFVGVFKDHNVLLTWNYKILESQYNSYILERSSDQGSTFQQVSKEPLTPLSDPEIQNTGRMVYMDSLPQNNKEYQYRIKGISPFGEVGPASVLVKGMGQKGQYFNPAIINTSLSKDQKSAVITWEFPEEGLEGLSHFQVVRADEVKGHFVPVISKIDKNLRSAIVPDIQIINYYSVTAVGLDGSKRHSFPAMVQPDDAIPPLDPRGLIGEIDSTGVVTLQWTKNLEPDLLGYRVFRANLEGEEFTQITFKPIPQNTITDTIPIKTLVKKVYYKVQAFDKRYNPSGFSEILELKRPDIIPPTPPVFTKFKTEGGKVFLNWIPSSSEDATKTLIYRKEKGKAEDWQLIADKDISIKSHADTYVKESTHYLYTLLTMDESGLESEPVRPISISTPTSKVKPEISRFTATTNRELKHILLSWNYREKGVTEMQLFKAKEGEQPTLYRVFENDEKQYLDSDLLINTSYTYLLQAVFDNGSRSKMTKEEIKY